ncbi:3-phosphoshikimate 1-carboxyvinyltransferase [Flavobacterium akiainvivens]|uniref:3-phosphoshikimate 1-carboxyvinyltransferase n=1 Tax=Flavobacterium akiainvivens TaxID=1202724 RepID=A0A0M9VI60_9FLAO|nr:3-phosphoshikimate 1-carboxyvinyltransferase [Flavobacterium akiainvivens]KOS06310.1 3-phosphoshikimate 1-carboxyvinyltransferase [Flavobacterium akiainvivens]SFQ16615.1 3-phosphoshikimate 1-carboxyvinyltransferase [Flavobacterium akiainvivens]
MNIKISTNGPVKSTALKITGSKSETNRLLLLQALFEGITIQNASESDDSIAMQQALASNESVVDIHHAGTAMRFLTAYFSQKEGRSVVLTGSQRMKERPIGVLVDALRALGADIQYAENEGYPPLKINGKKLTGSTVSINAGVSSQYITALMLIGAKLPNGLQLTLEGEVTSVPYINMTQMLLAQAGINSSFEGNVITVQPLQSEIINLKSEIVVESDWSSASYFYSIVALSPVGTEIALSTYKELSFQGDSALADIYREFGVSTEFKDGAIILSKENRELSTVNFELNNTPDIAQTIAVTCFGLGMGCHLTGLHTLKIKETDRLEALKAELSKFGADITVTNDSLSLSPTLSKGEGVSFTQNQNSEVGTSEVGSPPLEGLGEAAHVATYNDHRMAMAFAPLAIKTPFVIQDAGVVSKSFPTFWEDLSALSFQVSAFSD